MIETLKAYTIAGNSLLRISVFFAIILGSLVIGKILQAVLRKSSVRLETAGRPVMASFIGAVARAIVFLAFTVGLSQAIALLYLDPAVAGALSTAASVLFTVAVGWIIYSMVSVVEAILKKGAAKTESKMDDMLVPMVVRSLQVTIVVLILVQIATIISNQPITSILAGLGVGGLAIALAAQDTVKNFFGSLLILADKPFEIGDRVNIDGHDGPIEKVGFRSTRLRTLDGHLVTIPNGELANKTIHNIGKRPYIRRVFDVGVTYDTAPDKIDTAIKILKELLDNHEGLNPEFPPRVFFADFGAFSINIRVIYWYFPPNYWDYVAFSEDLNGKILRRFNDEGIEFAFPSQTLYLAGDDNRPINMGRPSGSAS